MLNAAMAIAVHAMASGARRSKWKRLRPSVRSAAAAPAVTDNRKKKSRKGYFTSATAKANALLTVSAPIGLLQCLMFGCNIVCGQYQTMVASVEQRTR